MTCDASALERQSRGVTATYAGEELARQVRDLFAQMDRIKGTMSGCSHGARGLVRVHASASPLPEQLIASIATFTQAHPLPVLSLSDDEEIETAATSEILQALRELDKHRQVATSLFEQWADEWPKKEVEKSNAVGSSRCATPRPSRCSSCVSATPRIASSSCTGKTSSVRTYFMRSYEVEGKLETRDRVRSIGEQICDYVSGRSPHDANLRYFLRSSD